MSDAAKQRFRRAFASLPDREREVAVLLYVKNLTLREIGDILAVSESRVCQIHGELKKKLRVALKDEAAVVFPGRPALSPPPPPPPRLAPRGRSFPSRGGGGGSPHLARGGGGGLGRLWAG